MPERLPVPDKDLTRLHSEQWSNVNGWHDYLGGGDLLHISPYVNIDDEC